MRILLVVATSFELKPIMDDLGSKTDDPNFYSIQSNKHELGLLVTGIGPIFTTFELTRHLSHNTYDLVINAGICGAFSSKYEIGEVLEIVEDQFADVGIDDNGTFKTLFEMGFMNASQPPFIEGKLFANAPFKTGLRKASAITVSKTNGSSASIESVHLKFAAKTESMEGAACFYASHKSDIPCLQIRSVSNFVEPRDFSRWNIQLAIKNLNKEIIHFLENI